MRILYENFFMQQPLFLSGKGKRSMKSSKRRNGFLAACIAPALILFFVFMILPTLNVFRMSLYEKGAYSPTETFVGLKNFQVLMNDSNFILQWT